MICGPNVGYESAHSTASGFLVSSSPLGKGDYERISFQSCNRGLRVALTPTGYLSSCLLYESDSSYKTL